MAKCERCGSQDFDDDNVSLMEIGVGGIAHLCVPCVRQWRKFSWNDPLQIEFENTEGDIQLFEMMLKKTGDYQFVERIQDLRRKRQEIEKKMFKQTQEFLGC